MYFHLCLVCMRRQIQECLLVLLRQLKGLNKKISSCAVDTDVVALAIPVVQQLWVAELWGWQKSLASLGVKSNCLAFFIHSKGAIYRPLSSVGKLLGGWPLSLKNHPQNTFAPLDNASQYCMAEQVCTYTDIDMARKHWLTKKVCMIKWQPLWGRLCTQHIKAHVCGSALEQGKW